MKKSALLIPLALVSSLAVNLPAFAVKGAVYAPPAAEMSRYHNGFYVGGSIGGNQYVGDFDPDLFVAFAPFDSDVFYTLEDPDEDLNIQSAGFGGQLQLGYGLFGDTFFIAAEVSVNATSNSNSLGHDNEIDFFDSFEGISATVTSDADVQLNTWEPVIDIKPGFKVGLNTLLYARVGAAFNKIEISDTVHFSEFLIGPDVTLTRGFEVSESESVVGLRLGAGMEHRFSDNMAVNVDYVYTTYGSVDVSGIGDIPTFDNGDFIEAFEVSDSIKVTRDMVMIGLNYYF